MLFRAERGGGDMGGMFSHEGTKGTEGVETFFDRMTGFLQDSQDFL